MVALVIGILLLVPLLYAMKPAVLGYVIRAFTVWGKQRVLHRMDHELIAKELRAFAYQNRWDQPPTGFPVTYLSSDEPAFPETLRALNASGIRIFDNRAELEFGGTPLHFGIAVFRERDEGRGVQRLGDGVWFYSEDGRVLAR